MNAPVSSRAGRWRGRLISAGLIVLALIAVTAGVHGWRWLRGRKEYQEARTRYEAAGGPTNPAGLRPATPSSGSPATEQLLKALGLEPSNFISGGPETWEDTPKVLQIEEEPDPEEWQEIESLVAQAAPRIALAIQAAPEGAVVYPLRYEDHWAMLMPHIRPLITTARLIQWDLRCRKKNGIHDGRWERINALFGLADSLDAEPVMVSQLVRLVIMEIGLTCLEEELGSSVPPDLWRKKLESRLDEERLREGMRRCCIFELAMTHETITRFFNGEPTSTELDRDVKGFTKWASLPETMRGAARALDRLGRIRVALDHPVDRTIDETEAVMNESRGDSLGFGFIMAAYPRSWRTQLSTAARVALAREAIRLRIQVQNLGAAPESIADLRKDPVFDRPFVYRKTEKGFELVVAAEPHELESRCGKQDAMKWACPKSPSE